MFRGQVLEPEDVAVRSLLNDPSYFMEKGETTRLSKEEGRLALAKKEEEERGREGWKLGDGEPC